MNEIPLLIFSLFGVLLTMRLLMLLLGRRSSKYNVSMECLSISEIPRIEEFDEFEDIKIHISASIDFTTWVEPAKPCPEQRDLVISKAGYFPFMNAPYRGDPIGQFGCVSTHGQRMLEHVTN